MVTTQERKNSVFEIIKPLAGLYSTGVAITAVAILFVAAWFTGNMPYHWDKASASSWHYSGSSWGTFLQLLSFVPLLGFFELLIISMVEFFERRFWYVAMHVMKIPVILVIWLALLLFAIGICN